MAISTEDLIDLANKIRSAYDYFRNLVQEANGSGLIVSLTPYVSKKAGEKLNGLQIVGGKVEVTMTLTL